MTFAARITRRPRPHDPDAAAEVGRAFGDVPPEVARLLAGAAGGSPYLAGLLSREAEWLREALEVGPETALDRVLASRIDDAARDLRRDKRRVALLTALADLGGIWDLEAVTDALSRFADRASDVALRAALAAEARKLVPSDAEAHGVALIAMGKMGAGELNYSSDIDLICLFDEAAYPPGEVSAARSGLVRAVRRMGKILGEVGPEGYVFRTDLRLRPDPSVTPVCVGMAAAERYYEALGRTWERAAHIKARAAAGDIAGGAAYLRRIQPFVWRRHLDFAAIEEAHALLLRIHEREGPDDGLDGRSVKLARGGIRDVEFFAQTLQLIAGGRDPALRVRGTVDALGRLRDAGWVEAELAGALVAAYRAHREVEHRLQMVSDLQTHDLPRDPEGWARIAALMDRDAPDLRREIEARFERVAALTAPFFTPERHGGAGPALTDRQAQIVEGWAALPALRSERARDIFDRVRPALLEQLLDGPAPDRALTHFDGFLRGLPAGVQVFSLFQANPDLLGLIAEVAGTSADLSEYLSRHPRVLDAVIGGSFFAPWPGMRELAEDLGQSLASDTDYERRLDLARGWAKEWHFRIGVHLLRGLIGGTEAGAHYADLAEAVLAALFPVVVEAFAERHGPPPGRGAMVLAMGSLGAGHLTARSDLDLIVVYDDAGQAASDGARPLPSRTYYARLTQALVTALGAPMREGRLYEVDMRLRPSGKQGPVATSLAAYARYQRDEAWSWEHLVQTRARPVAGTPAVMAAVAAVRSEVIAMPRDADRLRRDVAEMVARLRRAKPGGLWDVKSGPGGLTEIELVAQMGALLARSEARRVADQVRAAGLPQELARCHAILRRFQDARRLLARDDFDPGALGPAGTQTVLRETGERDMDALHARLRAAAAEAAQRVDEVLYGG